MQKNIVNSDMAVITLPMKPHRKEKIGMIVIPSIADVLAKRIGAKSYLGINLMDSYVKRSDFIDDYYNLLYQMDIDVDDVWVDTENEPELFSNVQKLIDNGFIKEKKLKVLRCPCGVIDMKSGSANDFVTKRSYIMKDNEVYCKECGEKCRDSIEKVLVFNASNIDFKSKTLPSRIAKDQLEFHKRLKDEDILVSRVRDTKVPVVVNGTKYNIDIDFAALTYLSCFDENQRVIIGSNHHVYQMYMMQLLQQCLENESENLYVAVPYVRPPADVPFDLKKELFSLSNSSRESYIFGSAFKFKNTVNTWSPDLLKCIGKLNESEAQRLYEKMTTPITISKDESLEKHVNNAVNKTNIQRMLNEVRNKKDSEYEK